MLADWSRFFFFKQKTAYEMRISDWSSDVCSSDLHGGQRLADAARRPCRGAVGPRAAAVERAGARPPPLLGRGCHERDAAHGEVRGRPARPVAEPRAPRGVATLPAVAHRDAHPRYDAGDGAVGRDPPGDARDRKGTR